MLLIANPHPNLDLAKIGQVTETWCSLSSGEIIIHLCCQPGDEQRVYENLPKWVHDEMTVTKSHTHVFIEKKK